MYIVLFCTTKNQKEAKKISKKLLNKKLVACSNITKRVDSLFSWKNKVESEKESLMILKSKKKLFKKICKIIKKHHSYETQEIIAIPIVEGEKSYLKWIDSTCQGKSC